jgi:hypothetical protein
MSVWIEINEVVACKKPDGQHPVFFLPVFLLAHQLYAVEKEQFNYLKVFTPLCSK